MEVFHVSNNPLCLSVNLPIQPSLLIWRPFLMLIGVSLSKSENSGRMLREGQAEVYQIDMWDINEGSLALFE